MVPVPVLEGMALHDQPCYSDNCLLLGSCHLIKPTAMQILMSFLTDVHTVLLQHRLTFPHRCSKRPQLCHEKWMSTNSAHLGHLSCKPHRAIKQSFGRKIHWFMLACTSKSIHYHMALCEVSSPHALLAAVNYLADWATLGCCCYGNRMRSLGAFLLKESLLGSCIMLRRVASRGILPSPNHSQLI